MKKSAQRVIAASLATVAAVCLALLPGTAAAAYSFSPHPLRYVALGDSVAAGLGLPPASDASEQAIACGRSPLAYSNKVATQLNQKLAVFNVQVEGYNIACQGATTDNLSQPQVVGSVTLPAQLDAAFAAGTPALISLTMGANDARWAQFIGACLSAANCNTPENTTAAQAHIDAMKTKLVASLQDIKSRSRFLPPAVVITGYYNPVSAQCAAGGLNLDEITWISDETKALNKALAEATRQPGTSWFSRFAPVDFAGHDICSADSWIQRPGVTGEPAPFHPTARGQEAIAESVLASLGI